MISTRFYTFFLLGILSIFGNPLLAQTSRTGQWIDHLPYHRTNVLALGNDKVYCATDYGIFYYDKSDHSFNNRINKATPNLMLSDIGISDIAYSNSSQTLVVAYTNSNIDLIKGNTVVNIPDIKIKDMMGNKIINRIFLKDKYAYLLCGFGIVVIDLDKEETKDTYFIGPNGAQINVNDLAFDEATNMFYAATDEGILKANANSNLAYFANWEKETGLQYADSTYNFIVSFGGKIVANYTNGVYDQDRLFAKSGDTWTQFRGNFKSLCQNLRVCGNLLVISDMFGGEVFDANGNFKYSFYSYNRPDPVEPDGNTIWTRDAYLDSDQNLWIADYNKGLWRLDASNASNLEKTGTQYLINGPLSTKVYAMEVSGKTLWTVAGGKNISYVPLYNQAEFNCYSNSSWKQFSKQNYPILDGVTDLLAVAIEPNNPTHALVATYSRGIFECNNGQIVKQYDWENSSLQYYVVGKDTCTFVAGVAFDSDRNLWASNRLATNSLSVKTLSGAWTSFDFGKIGLRMTDIGNIIIDQANQKWVELRENKRGILVFSENGTIPNKTDDKMKMYTIGVGYGNLPDSPISTMALDQSGQIWLGSNKGVYVIYSPESVFTTDSIRADAQPVQVEEDGFLHTLLDGERVQAIAVNGDNEKWFGTEKSGVYLMSEDGSKQVYHFTAENSPLLSNSVNSIKIDSDGMIYFATSEGIVAFRDYKIPPSPTYDSLIVYPNPVRETYRGDVYIRGLVQNSNIKITTISGTLVKEIRVSGGQAQWDGTNFNGDRVSTGVYLIFATDPNGEQRKTAKVLFIK